MPSTNVNKLPMYGNRMSNSPSPGNNPASQCNKSTTSFAIPNYGYDCGCSPANTVGNTMYFNDNQSQVVQQFDPQFPGFPGSAIDYTKNYNSKDECCVKEFHDRMGAVRPSHLSTVHQPVDAFLGSYRDFEFYNSGCYPSADTRVYMNRQLPEWLPGPQASGIDSSQVLTPGGIFPEITSADGFQDILIDAPRNLMWTDNVFDQPTCLTTTKLQSYDLRGDVPVKIQENCGNWGMSQSTIGPYECCKPVREFGY